MKEHPTTYSTHIIPAIAAIRGVRCDLLQRHRPGDDPRRGHYGKWDHLVGFRGLWTVPLPQLRLQEGGGR